MNPLSLPLPWNTYFNKCCYFGEIRVVKDKFVDGGYTEYPVPCIPSPARAVIQAWCQRCTGSLE